MLLFLVFLSFSLLYYTRMRETKQRGVDPDGLTLT